MTDDDERDDSFDLDPHDPRTAAERHDERVGLAGMALDLMVGRRLGDPWETRWQVSVSEAVFFEAASPRGLRVPSGGGSRGVPIGVATPCRERPGQPPPPPAPLN